MDAILTSILFRHDCPEIDTLLEFVAGILDDGKKESVEKHLATYPFCRDEVGVIAGVGLGIGDCGGDNGRCPPLALLPKAGLSGGLFTTPGLSSGNSYLN